MSSHTDQRTPLAPAPSPARPFPLGSAVRVRVPNLDDEPRYVRTVVDGYVSRGGVTAYYSCADFPGQIIPADRMTTVELCECGDPADRRCRCYFN